MPRVTYFLQRKQTQTNKMLSAKAILVDESVYWGNTQEHGWPRQLHHWNICLSTADNSANLHLEYSLHTLPSLHQQWEQLLPPPPPTVGYCLWWRGLLRQPGPLVSFSRLCLPSEREYFSPEETPTQPPLAGQLKSLCVFPYAWRLEGENWLPTWLASTNLSSGFHMVFLLYLREGQKERKKENLPLLILFNWVFPLMTSLRLHYHLKSLPP